MSDEIKRVSGDAESAIAVVRRAAADDDADDAAGAATAVETRASGDAVNASKPESQAESPNADQETTVECRLTSIKPRNPVESCQTKSANKAQTIQNATR